MFFTPGNLPYKGVGRLVVSPHLYVAQFIWGTQLVWTTELIPCKAATSLSNVWFLREFETTGPTKTSWHGGIAQKIPSHKSHKTYTIEHPLDAPREFRMWIVGWLSKLRPLPLIEKLCQREIGSTNIWNHHLDNPIGPRYLKITFDLSSPFPAKQHNLCGPTFEYSTFTTFGATQDDLRN